MAIVRVPDTYQNPDLAEAGLLAITAWSPIYDTYPGDHGRIGKRYIPLAFMFQRWDGRLGWFGGKVDPKDRAEPDTYPGENLACKKAAVRETLEEGGIDVEEDMIHQFLSHTTDLYLVRMFHWDLRATSVSNLREILRDAMRRPEMNFAEGCPVLVHLADYGHGRGWANLINGNNLMPGVREELITLRAHLYADAPAVANAQPLEIYPPGGL